MLRFAILAMIVIVIAFFVALLLTGCTLVVETRSSAECKPQEGCRAESVMKRSGENKELP